MKNINFRLSLFLRSNRWSILLLLTIAVYLLILSNFTLWQSVGIPKLKAPFADMQAILSASDAYREGYNPYIENPHDPLGRKHVYSRPWLWLGYTGLTRDHSKFAAILLITFFFLLSIRILRPENSNEFLLSAMLLLSPAVLLGVERGNNDLIIFILLSLAVFSLNNKNHLLDLIAYFFLFLASILKFYPIASFLIFVRIIKDYKKFWMFALFSILFFGVYAVFSFSDFEYLKNIVPKPHGRFTFGAAIFFEWILDEWPVNATYIYFMAVAVFFLAFLLSSRTGLAEVRNNSINTIFFLVGSLNILFCFFANTNYDYRCIFFVLILPWLFENLKCEITPVSTKRFIKLLLLFLPVVVWNETIITLIGLKVGSPGITETKLFAMVNLYKLEHLSTWIVITILLAFCIELLKTPIGDKMTAPFSKATR
jgi:hypothetical protein